MFIPKNISRKASDHVQSKYSPIVLPRNKKYGNNCWDARGPKVGLRDIVLYSDLEFDHWLTVESDPNVLTYCEQPLEITFAINGKLHSSIFDMWILYKNGTEIFIEVKYEAELLSEHKKYERTKRQIESQQLWCKEHGYLHETRTEKSIRAGKYKIENMLKMITNITNLHPPNSMSVIKECITGRTQLSEVCKKLSGSIEPHDVLLAVQWLCYEGTISANLNGHVWGYEMEVWENEQNPIA